MPSVQPCVKCNHDIWYLPSVVSLQDPFELDVGSQAICDSCGEMNYLLGTAKPTSFKFSGLSALKRNQYLGPVPNHYALGLVHNVFITNMDRVLAFGKLPTFMKFHFDMFRKHFKSVSRRAGITARAGADIKRTKRVPLSYKQTDSAFRFVPNEGMFIGLDGLLSAMLTGTWTAFETL